jgi:hypothetical protein
VEQEYFIFTWGWMDGWMMRKQNARMRYGMGKLHELTDIQKPLFDL